MDMQTCNDKPVGFGRLTPIYGMGMKIHLLEQVS